jgi:hypothetical protein
MFLQQRKQQQQVERPKSPPLTLPNGRSCTVVRGIGRIEIKKGVLHCIAGSKGAEFDLGGTKVYIEENGEWDIDSKDAVVMDYTGNNVKGCAHITIQGTKFCFSKDGTPLNYSIRKMRGSMIQMFL